MKPHFHKVAVPIQNSFSVRHDKLRNFGKLLHYHPELELHYTIKGHGIRLIGDNVSHFQEGEVILLGENLPHAWKGKETELEGEEDYSMEAIVVQFSVNCLGKGFFDLPESYLIPRIFESAKKGLLIQGQSADMIKDLMLQMTRAGRFERVLTLLQILQIISEKEEVKTIASAHAFYKPNERESERLNNVIAHTLSNFKREINLEEIAQIANLSVNAFCRYFKKQTNMTFTDFVNHPGIIQDTFSRGCFARINVGNNSNVPYLI